MPFTFSEPWHACDGTRLKDELRREVCQKHVLHGIDAKIIARRQDCDQFLFELDDGRFAEVHLTWSKETDPAWPDTRIYDSAEQAWAAIQRDIEEWRELDSN
jgi:hypothetical protein